MQIESGIPIPSAPGSPRYPWDSMGVGDSFYLKGEQIARVTSAANYRAKKRGEGYACRTIDGGVRVWRIK